MPLILGWYCHFDVSPVNYSDSEHCSTVDDFPTPGSPPTFHATFVETFTHGMVTYDTGYPHDGRADNAAYRHDRRADKRRYRHDREIEIQMLNMFKN